MGNLTEKAEYLTDTRREVRPGARFSELTSGKRSFEDGSSRSVHLRQDLHGQYACPSRKVLVKQRDKFSDERFLPLVLLATMGIIGVARKHDEGSIAPTGRYRVYESRKLCPVAVGNDAAVDIVPKEEPTVALSCPAERLIDSNGPA